jgi:hypothetical protein
MSYLKLAFSMIDGGVARIAEATGVSHRAVGKWQERGKLPRTEFSEETTYAKTISELPVKDGAFRFSAEELLRPTPQFLNRLNKLHEI